jgi:hypothetical protein
MALVAHDPGKAFFGVEFRYVGHRRKADTGTVCDLLMRISFPVILIKQEKQPSPGR